MIMKQSNDLCGLQSANCGLRLLKEPGDFFWRIDEEAGTVFF